MKSMYWKCKAKSMKCSALDIKPQEELQAVVDELSGKIDMLPLMALFGVTSSSFMALSYLFLKKRQ